MPTATFPFQLKSPPSTQLLGPKPWGHLGLVLHSLRTAHPPANLSANLSAPPANSSRNVDTCYHLCSHLPGQALIGPPAGVCRSWRADPTLLSLSPCLRGNTAVPRGAQSYLFLGPSQAQTPCCIHLSSQHGSLGGHWDIFPGMVFFQTVNASEIKQVQRSTLNHTQQLV